MVVDRQSHPYEINLRQLLIQGISRIEPRNIGGDATLGTPLPASVMELLDNVPSVSAAERITGRYAKRLRTMIWLVDRFIQLEAAAQFGGRGPQTAMVSIDIPATARRSYPSWRSPWGSPKACGRRDTTRGSTRCSSYPTHRSSPR